MPPDTLGLNLEKAARYLLALLILVVLCTQLSSLYVFPMPDSARWWGDETGQIIELKTELETGHASIPIGLGSTVAVTNGIVRGNSWMAAILYGLPALVFEHSADLVSIGRTITAILSWALLIAVYFCARSFGVSSILSELAVLFLITTRSFLFASHAARLDIAAGLAVLFFITYTARKVRFCSQGTWKPYTMWFFFFGVVTFSLATLSIHLLTLLAPVSLYALWKLGAFKNLVHFVAAIGGVLAVATILFLLYLISGAPITLFGVTSEHTQFHSVVSEIPITKLFSRSVQFSNVQQRWEGFWSEAPSILILIAFALVATFINFKKKESPSQHFLVISSAIVFVSWLLFQSYAIYYYAHVLPLLIVLSMVAISKLLQDAKRAAAIASIGLGFVIAHFGFYDALHARENGSRLSNANRDALTSAFALPAFHGNVAAVVLIQNPGLAWLMHNTCVRVMSPHFLSFPLDGRSASEVLRTQHAKYAALYFDPQNAKYSDEITPLRNVADSLGTPIGTFTGVLFDAGRNYFDLDTTRIDTLRLYSLPF